jgi:hypothetical protein
MPSKRGKVLDWSYGKRKRAGRVGAPPQHKKRVRWVDDDEMAVRAARRPRRKRQHDDDEEEERTLLELEEESQIPFKSRGVTYPMLEDDDELM